LFVVLAVSGDVFVYFLTYFVWGKFSLAVSFAVYIKEFLSGTCVNPENFLRAPYTLS
jgi:hypothetical protein